MGPLADGDGLDGFTVGGSSTGTLPRKVESRSGRGECRGRCSRDGKGGRRQSRQDSVDCIAPLHRETPGHGLGSSRREYCSGVGCGVPVVSWRSDQGCTGSQV